MSENRPGVTGMATPHPQDQPNAETQSLPDEEHIDPGTVEDDLSESPEEKHNATDGYAPADDEDAPDTLELDELED